MSQRYSLRFETGERAGEVVPITGAVFTVGRKPGNSLQIVENSVSGQHAELRIDEQGVRLEDLGSTNGTRVGSERVLEARLAAGSTVTFGNVGCTFLDAEVGSASRAQAPESARVVSEENLARSRKVRGSKLGLVLMVVIAAAGGGTWWWLDQGGGRREEPLRPIPSVAGNLLGDGYSFEARAGWEGTEALPVVFQINARSRYSGQRGLGASLEASESAEHRSPEVPLRRGGGVLVSARVRSPGDASARIGVHFLPAPGGESTPGAATLWSAPLANSAGWQQVEFAAATPGGYSRAQVLVRADAPAGSGGGRVDVDDVSLAPGAGAAIGRVGEAEVFLDRGTLTLFKVDRVLISGLHVRPPDATLSAGVDLTVTMQEHGALLAPSASGLLVLRAEAPLVSGGLATLGDAGYTPREGEFEASGVTDVLLGRDHDLVRLALDGSSTLRARRVDSGLELRAVLPGGARPRIQLAFREEGSRVIELTAHAKDAEREGRRGRALALWQELLDEVPFRADAVAEAQAARARLVQAGFEEARALADEIERARFFRLVDLYRQCRDQAEDISRRYDGSEVDQKARELIAGIDQDLAGLEADLDRFEVQRLRAILAGLRAQQATQLAAEVERYLQEQYGEVQ